MTTINVSDYTSEATDDANVQNALAAALLDGSSLYFPAGTWELTESLVLDPPTGAIQVYGDGPASILNFTDGGTISSGAAIHIGKTLHTNGIHIRDLTVKGADSSILYGIRAYGSTATSTRNLRISGVRVDRFADTQIRVEKSYNSNISDCYITGGKIGMSLGKDFSIGCSVVNNWVRDWENAGIQVGTEPASGQASSHVVVSRNIVDQTSNVDVSATPYDASKVQSEYPTCPIGIHLLPGTSEIEVASNHLEDIANGVGILVKGSVNSKIMFNSLYSLNIRAMHYGVLYGGIGSLSYVDHNSAQGTYNEDALF